ncbi:hypothetical protein [Haloferula sp. A504]|uniref:hypothetical protein n=1 Tax=Haloferula sp. A504 TaxID=3373601 RepID=UPI0031BD86D9|nr:hypothetical protein [Verrucomicrobiaceae bacterium E54]
MTDDSSQLSPPDWATCSEEQLWHYVAWHLEGAGIRSVLVGGAVVSIHTEGLYRSGDLDLIPDDLCSQWWFCRPCAVGGSLDR